MSRCISNFKNGDFPASYVCLPEDTAISLLERRVVQQPVTIRSDDLDLLNSGLEGLPFHHACSLAVLGQICSTILAQILAPSVLKLLLCCVLMNDDGLLLVNDVFFCWFLLDFYQQKSLWICYCRSFSCLNLVVFECYFLIGMFVVSLEFSIIIGLFAIITQSESPWSP